MSSGGEAFVYDTGMAAWYRIADRRHVLSELHSDLFDAWNQADRGPLLRTQQLALSAFPHSRHLAHVAATAHAISSLTTKDRSTETLAHVESQMARALALRSRSEYRQWAETYVRRLVQDENTVRLREFCDFLVGPPYFVEQESHDQDDDLGEETLGEADDDDYRGCWALGTKWRPKLLVSWSSVCM